MKSKVALFTLCFLTGLIIMRVVKRNIYRELVEEKNMNAKGGKYSASTIAKWFLYYNDKILEEEDTDLISNLKLQKLLYYAQGCYLAIMDKPLFNDEIRNWEHGPVVEDVYHEYKDNKANGIDYNNDYNGEIDSETEGILREVYDVFGQYSAWGLRNMTHSETPWQSTSRNQVISNDIIKEYFKGHYISE